MIPKSGISLVHWCLMGFAAALSVAAMGSARAASFYRDTVCVSSQSKELDGEAVKTIDALVDRAATYPSGVAGTFVTVFTRGESVADLGHGLAAASALTKYLESSEYVRAWPADLRFLAQHDQPCPSARVLVELSLFLNEKPLVDPTR